MPLDLPSPNVANARVEAAINRIVTTFLVKILNSIRSLVIIALQFKNKKNHKTYRSYISFAFI